MRVALGFLIFFSLAERVHALSSLPPSSLFLNPKTPHPRSVTGTVRSPAKAASLTAAGIPCHALDLGGCGSEGGLPPPLAAGLASATHAVATAPPLADGHDPFLAALDLRAAAPRLAWVGYVSSTSVYGSDLGGAWVGEGSPVAPSTPAGTARAAAEAEWRAWAEAGAKVGGPPVTCVRAGGIYGPGRSALDIAAAATAAATEAGEGGRGPTAGAAASRRTSSSRLASHDSPTSRIHVHDLARGLLAAAAGMASAPMHPWAVVNAVDGEPAPRAVVVAAARALLAGAGVPGGDGGGGLSPSPTTGKRVRGDAFAALLAPAGGLIFPSYREGLRAIASGDGRPFC